MYLNFCIYLCHYSWYFELCIMCHFVVGSHMVAHMCDETGVHGDMLFHKEGVCDTYGISSSFN